VARSRVELFGRIRRDGRVEELSIRELAKRHKVHRRTGAPSAGLCAAGSRATSRSAPCAASLARYGESARNSATKGSSPPTQQTS
jgi:hypothetical protein